MDYFIIAVMAFVIGYVMGWIAHAKGLINRLLNDPDSMIKALSDYKNQVKQSEEEDSKSVREVRVEMNGNLFFLYDAHSEQFLAQGATLDDALNAARARFPGELMQGVLSAKEAQQMGLLNK